MNKKSRDINEVLDEFAHDVAKTAQLQATPFEEKLDAFKALTAYAALRFKMALKGADPDEDGETTMDDLRRTIAGERRNGRTASRVRDS
jgi:hypothetical protein